MTDQFDSKFITTFCNKFINDQIGVNDDYYFDQRKKYRLPYFPDTGGYVHFIKENFENVDAELYGFHRNAEIATNQNDSENMVANLCSIQPQISTSGTGESSDSKLVDDIKNFYNKIPELWDLEKFEEN